MAYSNLEPWGAPAEDLRNALLALTVARAAGSTKTMDGEELSPKHFMLRPPPEEEHVATTDEVARLLGL